MSIFLRLFDQIGARFRRDKVSGQANARSGSPSLKQPARKYPTSADELRQDRLLSQWWYYGIELVDGLGLKGIFPLDLPMLPRLMLRNCELSGMECLDLGTMEGLMPTLMCRGGAARVVATDATDHCLEKMAAVKHYYNVDFDFRTVGLMYDLHQKMPDGGFDLINCSGLLYHVVSPMHVLLGCRPLLKRNGLMIVSSNVVLTDRYLMEFNDGGRLQEEANTFWYLSVKYFDYLLRFLKLQPIDCAFYPHRLIQSDVRYVLDVPSGYLSVVCRATDEALPGEDDRWMTKALSGSWEMRGLTDWDRTGGQQLSSIRYKKEPATAFLRPNGQGIDLHAAVLGSPDPLPASDPADTHFLRLTDWS
jgi:2-polyprenyl-3-methyl-5-hydroxy-6-metoxy-1,4-benzoquinol methylase